MDYRTFLAFSVIGGTAWIWSMLFIGYWLGRYVPGVARHIELVILGSDLCVAAARFHRLVPRASHVRSHRGPHAAHAPDHAPTHRPWPSHSRRSSLPPFGFDALEPSIDAKTMEIHHDKHHAAYVTNLNAAVDKAPELAANHSMSLLAGIAKVPEAVRTAVRNNGGGHWNHSLLLAVAQAPKAGGEPAGALGQAVPVRLWRLREVQGAVRGRGNDAVRFGLGLAHSPARQAAITSTPNQDNPLMDGTGPLTCCSASMCGNTPTTSSIRIVAPNTSAPSGTSSTGPKSQSATKSQKASAHSVDRPRHSEVLGVGARSCAAFSFLCRCSLDGRLFGGLSRRFPFQVGVAFESGDIFRDVGVRFLP